jgi:cytochrome c oxidase subunit 3/cytochrome o ubiquinol oxidase subunit 3
LPSRKLAVWLFLGSEIMFFSALIFTYIILRLSSPDWPTFEQTSHVLNIPLTALNTAILIVSSVTVVLALEAAQRGRQRGLVAALFLTLVLGSVFLSIQAYEYTVLIGEGLTLTTTPIEGTDPFFGTTFFTMTGFHGLHVLGGVLTLLIVLGKAVRGHYTREGHLGVELFGLYWHFVDVVWILLFVLAYLI